MPKNLSFASDMEIKDNKPKYKMNTEAEMKNRNVSPLLYGVIDSKQRETLLGRLEELYNNLGIDTEFNTPDYLLAEYTLNCLVSYGNAVTKNIEKGFIKPSMSERIEKYAKELIICNESEVSNE